MSEYQEFTGRTVEEALRSARESFGVSGLDDLDFEILTPGSRGVLGMGAEPARIIAAPRSALGGAAPAPEAAAATPLPPPAATREDRATATAAPRDCPRDGRRPRPAATDRRESPAARGAAAARQRPGGAATAEPSRPSRQRRRVAARATAAPRPRPAR